MEEGVEIGTAVLPVTPNDPLGYFVLPILSILDSGGPDRPSRNLARKQGEASAELAGVAITILGPPVTRTEEGCPWQG